jgi:hypothetical protein
MSAGQCWWACTSVSKLASDAVAERETPNRTRIIPVNTSAQSSKRIVGELHERMGIDLLG